MIKTPRRSVTRFFIPMIDVLTLLFCMFLLLPIIQENASQGDEAAPPAGTVADELAREIEARQAQLDELYKDQERARALLADLSARKRELLQQHVQIQLLYVSPTDGALLYFDPANPGSAPLKIGSGPEAMALVERHRQEADKRELLYIFQEPRTATGAVAPFPTRAQEAAYREWFKTVNFDGSVRPPADKGAK